MYLSLLNRSATKHSLWWGIENNCLRFEAWKLINIQIKITFCSSFVQNMKISLKSSRLVCDIDIDFTFLAFFSVVSVYISINPLIFLFFLSFIPIHPLPPHTDSTKINRPGHNIRMYWTNFRQPTAHVKQNIFGKILIENCSPHLYASFGSFYAKIGPLFEEQWVFKVCLKIDN